MSFEGSGGITESDGAEVTSGGKPFQIWTPAIGQALAPTVYLLCDVHTLLYWLQASIRSVGVA